MTRKGAASLLFLGDLKGTQSSLKAFNTGGAEELAARLGSLHAAFGKAFLSFADRSLSLRGVTLSDSVFAEWTDVAEGIRFAAPFAATIFHELGCKADLFRGFIDSGPTVEETDPVLLALDRSNPRFLRVLPVSVAIWSTSLAEKSHFPPGLFVGEQIANRIALAEYEAEVFQAEHFQYRKIKLNG